MASDHSDMKLGKKTGIVHDYRTLALGTVVDTALVLPQAPKNIDRTHGLTFQMLGNDAKGDCTFAATQHGEHVMQRRDVEPADADVVDAYLAFTGGQDTGCYLLDVLNLWRQSGILSETITAFAKVDLSNPDEVHSALYLFGGLYIGIGLPVSAQTQEVWDAVEGDAGEPYSWGGHCVWVANRHQSGSLDCITWGEKKRMTPKFIGKYVDEAYAVIHPDWLARHKDKTPQGFNLQQLEDYLGAL